MKLSWGLLRQKGGWRNDMQEGGTLEQATLPSGEQIVFQAWCNFKSDV